MSDELTAELSWPASLCICHRQWAARKLACDLIARVNHKLEQLHEDHENPEALHDVRTSLRRLRACLQTFAEPLADDVPGRLARRLRDLARVTNPIRDLEVQIDWLASHGDGLSAGAGIAMDDLVSRMREQLMVGYGELRARWSDNLSQALRRLERRLSVGDSAPRATRRPENTFGWTMARLLGIRAEELRDALARVHTVAQSNRVHQARLAGKRLRYLIEPVIDHAKEAGQAVAALVPLHGRLKELQDVLGELRDLHLLTPVLEREYGLSEVVQRLQQRQTDLFARFQADWGVLAAEPFFADLHHVRGDVRRASIPDSAASPRECFALTTAEVTT